MCVSPRRAFEGRESEYELFYYYIFILLLTFAESASIITSGIRQISHYQEV